MDGYGGIWICVDGCGQKWMDMENMNGNGWVRMDRIDMHASAWICIDHIEGWGSIRMDTHGCALMDVDGYEYIHGWIWVDVGKCVSKYVFQKMSQAPRPNRDG